MEEIKSHFEPKTLQPSLEMIMRTSFSAWYLKGAETLFLQSYWVKHEAPTRAGTFHVFLQLLFFQPFRKENTDF